MTENEAIKRIKECRNTPNFQPYIYMNEALNMAIQALEEVQQYREKQILMKPKINRIDSETIYCKCPSCNITTVLYRNCIMNYCKECGQKLDWSGEQWED